MSIRQQIARFIQPIGIAARAAHGHQPSRSALSLLGAAVSSIALDGNLKSLWISLSNVSGKQGVRVKLREDYEREMGMEEISACPIRGRKRCR
jgi:hypothetical protein